VDRRLLTNQKQRPQGAYYPPCTVRGGSWQSGPVELSNDGRREFLSSSQDEAVGFRVIRLLSD
jgi:hypothetical protein